MILCINILDLNQSSLANFLPNTVHFVSFIYLTPLNRASGMILDTRQTWAANISPQRISLKEEDQRIALHHDDYVEELEIVGKYIF